MDTPDEVFTPEVLDSHDTGAKTWPEIIVFTVIAVHVSFLIAILINDGPSEI